jgi:lipoprotein signal peptidase
MALYFSSKINNYYSLKTRRSAYTVINCADVPIAHGFYADVYELFFFSNFEKLALQVIHLK